MNPTANICAMYPIRLTFGDQRFTKSNTRTPETQLNELNMVYCHVLYKICYLGSNKFASQKGMSIGSVRHVSDIKADKMTREGQGILNLQSGTNQFASQKGMSMGAVRHVSDIRADTIAPESHGLINLQSGK